MKILVDRAAIVARVRALRPIKAGAPDARSVGTRVTWRACRSPSPEPIYSTDGKRLNTREYRTRRKLEEERHRLVQRMQQINPEFKPPPDYKCVHLIYIYHLYN